MKIATYNINSIKARISNLCDWLKKQNPDIVLLQEIKCETKNFPYFELETLGYNVAVLGQKSYNGVAILSKYKFEITNRNLPTFLDDSSARYIEILVNNKGEKFYVMSVYAPNGCSTDKKIEEEKFLYKLKWFEKFYTHIKNLQQKGFPFIIGGDFNAMLEDIDVYDASKFKDSPLFRKEVKNEIIALKNMGLHDAFRLFNKNLEGYTFWDYSGNSFVTNLGLRIDYVFLSAFFADRIIEVKVDKSLREMERPSDHTALVAMFR